MTYIDNLNDKFSIENEVVFSKQENDLIFMTISNRHANADICLYGAHVTSFKPHNSEEILWMSPISSFEIGRPIRGGIPVCFPWFGLHKTDSEKPQHGFARLMYWKVMETCSTANGETMVTLQLNSSDETKAYWPYDFSVQLTVIVGKELKVSHKVTNPSNKPIEYTCALHSYYNLSATENISIGGLQGVRYHNQFEPGDFIQKTPKIKINKAETRHYHDTEDTCFIEDTIFERKISVAKSGSRVTTVWNPWAETCADISDLPDDAYKNFVCVEAVNAFDNVIKLSQGESHVTSTIIGLEEFKMH